MTIYCSPEYTSRNITGLNHRRQRQEEKEGKLPHPQPQWWNNQSYWLWTHLILQEQRMRLVLSPQSKNIGQGWGCLLGCLYFGASCCPRPWKDVAVKERDVLKLQTKHNRPWQVFIFLWIHDPCLLFPFLKRKHQSSPCLLIAFWNRYPVGFYKFTARETFGGGGRPQNESYLKFHLLPIQMIFR